jgi:hypothetical protein
MKNGLSCKTILFVLINCFLLHSQLYSQANTKLSNLIAPTAINQPLLPNSTGTKDLGSATLNWRNLYFSGNLYKGSQRFLSNNGSGNTFLGLLAGRVISTGQFNTGMGYHALYSTTSGKYNSAFGSEVLFSNSTGSYNTAAGRFAQYKNTSGNYNTSYGYSALYNNTTGGPNTAIGFDALYTNTTGANNTALGFSALNYNTTGNFNTATGYSTLTFNSTGTFNTTQGAEAMFNNTTGLLNTSQGYYSLHANSTGSHNTAIGAYANVTVDNLSNATALGSNAVVNANNKVRIGDVNVTVVESQVGSWTTSDGRFKTNIKEEVKGLEFIKLLRPVVYNFDAAKFEAHLIQNYPDSIKSRSLQQNREATQKTSAIRQTGLIAQEVAEAARKVNYDFNGVHAPENPTDNWSLSYEKLVVPLIKAVQEQQQQIDKLEQENSEIKNQLAELKALVMGHTGLSTTSMSEAVLEQNTPNPFDRSTSIKYAIPSNFQSAQLLITDNAGRTIKAIALTSASGVAYLDGYLLSGGTYTYSLVIDGKITLTKKMVVTK